MDSRDQKNEGENLKFVNKFEFDTVWGDNEAGDIGADGKIFEVKNSYIDFTLGNNNFKVGMQGGTIARGFIFAAGAHAGLFHGQFIYSSGDDGTDATEDNEFKGPHGNSYYWSEMLGYGMFDNDVPSNSPNEDVNNLMALNVGVTLKPMEKLTLRCDLWYAMHTEKVNNEDELGFEVDLSASYQILDDLKFDVVAAYLAAGDAIGPEDPIEVGTQLSLSF